VRLRPFREADLDLFTRFAVDSALSEPFSWFGFRSPEGYRRRWEEDGFLHRSPHSLAVAEANGPAIGWVTWRENERPGAGVWEIGALIAPECRGRGAGTTAQRLLVEHLFATTTVHRVWAGTEVDNAAERRALEKCGFRMEGQLRGAVYRAGQWRDSLIFGIVREDLTTPTIHGGRLMRLSTRNQLPGTVEDVQLGGIMASVKVNLRGGDTLTAAITREAAEELALANGTEVTVLIKATEVMLAVE
jgi:molybdopterin-binding protein